MARIAGVDLQDNWKVDYALTKIKGIGWTLSKKILRLSKIDSSKRLAELKAEELSAIASNLEGQLIEGELARVVRSNISRLRQIGSYRGIRHARSLPARGQRTKSNARTKRGKRKTVGAFKKEALGKMQQAKSE
jgi:small subunit ribosomal protein S13